MKYEIYKIRHPENPNENPIDNLITSTDAVVSYNVRQYNLNPYDNKGGENVSSEVKKIIEQNPRDFFNHFIRYYSYNKTPIIEFNRKIMENNKDPKLIINKSSSGGSKASVKKEICGKQRCIYKIPGSRKEHIKYMGRLIAVADYKKLMKKA